MAETYRLSGWRRLLNGVVKILLRVGWGLRHTYLLTVRGRRSGKLYSTPVMLMEDGTHRWLVAPSGAVAWVRNARAAGQVTPSRGRHSETVMIVELGPEEAAPVLQQYGTAVPITRPFFDATPDAPLEAFVDEAPHHPVFRIHGVSRSCRRPSPSVFRPVSQMPASDLKMIDRPRPTARTHAEVSLMAAEYTQEGDRLGSPLPEACTGDDHTPPDSHH